MKNVLRWIFVLPGALLAMILTNILNGLTVSAIFPYFVGEISKSWFGSLVFVMTVYYIAPKGKVVTAVVVATAYCAVGTFAVLVALGSGEAGHPAWLEVTTAIISVAAAVLGCLIVHEQEKHKSSDALKESQKN